MMMYVNGQDIARLVLGTLSDGQWEIEPGVFDIRPEQYLQGMEDFLRLHRLERTDIGGFVLVKGPGSATSLRTSHALVNALAFALNVAVISIEKAPDSPDEDIVKDLQDQVGHSFALPTYAHDPNITKSNRDALKRKAH